MATNQLGVRPGFSVGPAGLPPATQPTYSSIWVRKRSTAARSWCTTPAASTRWVRRCSRVPFRPRVARGRRRRKVLAVGNTCRGFRYAAQERRVLRDQLLQPAVEVLCHLQDRGVGDQIAPAELVVDAPVVVLAQVNDQPSTVVSSTVHGPQASSPASPGFQPMLFWPSIVSRMMSAWPACWAVSAAMWRKTRRTDQKTPGGCHGAAGSS